MGEIGEDVMSEEEIAAMGQAVDEEWAQPFGGDENE